MARELRHHRHATIVERIANMIPIEPPVVDQRQHLAFRTGISAPTKVPRRACRVEHIGMAAGTAGKTGQALSGRARAA